MISRIAVLAPLVVLVGCGEAAYLSYQGRPAETALECKAAYEEAKDRSRNVSVGTDRGSLIGAAIGRGIVESSVNSAYNECLARVSALPGGGMSTKVPAATVAPKGVTSGCSRGGGVMQGGTGYCTR
jgi:hypothetical protein